MWVKVREQLTRFLGSTEQEKSEELRKEKVEVVFEGCKGERVGYVD